MTRLIRDWKADIVLGHRPNDYHPDHRAVGQLIQDASYMVTVPFFCPDTPALTRNPVFLSYEDRLHEGPIRSGPTWSWRSTTCWRRSWRRWKRCRRSSTKAGRTGEPRWFQPTSREGQAEERSA